jgi:GTPase SAR1 family protein
MLEGLLALEELNMYGNKVSEIIIPRNPKLLTKLETLNLGYNDLAYLPEDLDQLKALRVLKVMNNFLEKVPMRICDMDIRTIDVSSNPVIRPPIETCERGICSMKRYYHCLRLEEQSKHKAVEENQRNATRQKKKEEKSKFRHLGRFFGSKGSPTPTSSISSSTSSFQEGVPTPMVTKEEPVVMPSKKSGPVLMRKRSISYDEAMSEAASPMDPPTPQAQIQSAPSEDWASTPVEHVTVNDTLKVIFVGMAMAGKTSMIKRLIEGRDAVIPQRDERTIGVDIYEWDPKTNRDRRPVDTKIELETELHQDVHAKFSVWDFAGQHVYHATHELFFSPRSLYVLVWDMGATNQSTQRRKSTLEQSQGAFKLSYDSSDEEEEDDFVAEEEARRADRALERDIDEKVQFWVECIQSCAPGAAILPVATFDDYFDDGEDEAKRRCNVLKNRLLKHEERRIAGIQERLDEYQKENRANDAAALRLRKLLCPYTRPKLIFGNDGEESVVRVSGTRYTGFEKLTEKIVNMATGRDKAGSKYHIFRGHVGARIPRMRLEVREAVRSMRDRFKVVEWGYFLKTLAAERNLTSVEDISDALHFLTNIGELSYFGNVFPDKQQMDKMLSHMDGKMQCDKYSQSTLLPSQTGSAAQIALADAEEDDSFDDDDDEDLDGSRAVMSIDDTSITARSSRDDSSLSTMDDLNTTGLSQFVFLNPRWLVAAVACILRHDLDREIREARRFSSSDNKVDRFYEANLNCPVITADDACMLWQCKRFTKKAADRAQEYSNNMALTPFDFLQRLLVRFGVFVPIDLTIEKAVLGGKEYARQVEDGDTPAEIIALNNEKHSPQTPEFFFLPSLLGPGEPAEAWTYKNTDSWKATLCHSILFPDGVPPGLMERITASVLSSVYAVAKGLEHVVLATGINGQPTKILEGELRVKEILCWRTAFFLKLGTAVKADNSGETKESIVEIFAHLVDRDSHLCVGADYMGSGTRRLVVSAKGQVGDGGRKIWNGGYLLVIKSVGRLMSKYGGLEFEKQGFCPDCLSKKAVSEASHWDWAVVREAAQNGDGTMRCSHGHRVDTRLITGPCDTLMKQRVEPLLPTQKYHDSEPIVPVNDLLRGIVLVGLWDGKTRKVVRVGSGFVVDKKRGLIVTAAHTLMNIWGDKNYPFGENYYGLREGKVVIGMIPRRKESDTTDGTEAVFRYFASIVAKDPTIESVGECHLDACVLRITTRMETDVSGNGDGCGDQPEILLQNNPEALKREKLQHLKVTEKCELDEQVRILGYNQGGEGLLGPGESLNRYMDFARGYVCKKFASAEDVGLRHRFKPREEVVVICPTIGGHSGGPCVNQQGEVIGILSRADPAENQRCYLVPASAWKSLVKKAKSTY